jgi:hypothetical protein
MLPLSKPQICDRIYDIVQRSGIDVQPWHFKEGGASLLSSMSSGPTSPQIGDMVAETTQSLLISQPLQAWFDQHASCAQAANQ